MHDFQKFDISSHSEIPFLSINLPNPVGQSPHQMNQPPRDWHASITPDLRNHLVGKLVKAIIPYPEPGDQQRIQDVITYARNMENNMFETANDKEAYYRMLGEEIWQERMNQQLSELQLAADRI